MDKPTVKLGDIELEGFEDDVLPPGSHKITLECLGNYYTVTGYWLHDQLCLDDTAANRLVLDRLLKTDAPAREQLGPLTKESGR